MSEEEHAPKIWWSGDAVFEICQQTYRYIACNALNPCWGLSNNKKQYSQCILGTVIYNSATIIHFKGHMNVIFLPRDAMHPRY